MGKKTRTKAGSLVGNKSGAAALETKSSPLLLENKAAINQDLAKIAGLTGPDLLSALKSGNAKMFICAEGQGSPYFFQLKYMFFASTRSFRFFLILL
jgi:hypothetical protein